MTAPALAGNRRNDWLINMASGAATRVAQVLQLRGIEGLTAPFRDQSRPAGSNPIAIQVARCAGAVSAAMNLSAASRLRLPAMMPAA
jgi:hypothetical protein